MICESIKEASGEQGSSSGLIGIGCVIQTDLHVDLFYLIYISVFVSSAEHFTVLQ